MPQHPGPWRDGIHLVANEDTPMPPRCPLCNGEPAGNPLNVRFSTPRKGGLIGHAVGKAIDKAKNWNYTGPVDVAVHFCANHRGRRAKYYLLSLLLAVAGAVLIVVWFKPLKNGVSPPWQMFIGMVMAALAVFLALVTASGRLAIWFCAARYWDRTVWLKGVNPDFLATLPVYPDSVYEEKPAAAPSAAAPPPIPQKPAAQRPALERSQREIPKPGRRG